MDATHLSIQTSNRLPVLIEHLADRFAREPLPPLEREVIVVQSQGMARWITLELARRLGIAASLELPFPAAFCDDLARRLGGEAPPSVDPFERSVLTWRLFGALARLPDSTSFAPVRTYLRDDASGIRRYQLAARLAARFDDYQIYRPEMLVSWEGDRLTLPANDTTGREHEAWQAALWRQLVAETPHRPLAGRFQRLLEELQRGGPIDGSLPRRVTVFGVSSLPPIFLKVLATLARRVPVDIAFVSPTAEFWGDLRSEKEQRKSGQLSFDWEAPERPAAPIPSTNPLLASLGRQGRELFTLLQELDESGQAWEPLAFEPPPRDSLLHEIQADILELVDRRPRSRDAPPIERSADDRSLELHACHSPRREMEVLRDLLLDAFERDPELTPDQVLVLVPDIARYAPFVQAVFEVESSGLPRLPIHIADRTASSEDPLIAAFLLLLRTARSRFTASDVLGLLDQRPIRAAFGITEPDLPVVRQWVEATRVTWGLDHEQRSRDHELPDFEAPTWRSAVDRLLLGFATGPSDGRIHGILPHGEVLAGRIELLGRFAEFVETIERQLRLLRERRAGTAWTTVLQQALDTLFEASDEDEEAALLQVRRVIGETALLGDLGAAEAPIDLVVIEEHFSQAFSVESFGRGFLSGRITFCALKPMRTIPFRLIAIAGLDDGSFPRPTRPPHFDLIARRPRLGDRSIREDDRYLFLETLLAAQDRLILSWVGQSQKDDSRPAPSLCVSELLEQLGRMLGGLEKASELIVWHKMHAFSSAYFDGREARLFSYSSEDCSASAAAREDRREQAPFLSAPLVLPRDRLGPPPWEVDLLELQELWVHPAKYFCRRVLQLTLWDEDPTRTTQEPFVLEGLDRYQVDLWLLDRMAEEPPDREEALATLRQAGLLPARAFGEAALSARFEEIRALAEAVGPSERREPVIGELDIGSWRVRGRLDLRAQGEVRLLARPTKVKAKDCLRAWIGHLFLTGLAARGHDAPRSTRIVGTDATWEIGPVADWEPILSSLLEERGSALTAPLCFFEKSSQEYAQMIRDGKSDKALQAARRLWGGERYDRVRGECQDLYNELCHRQRQPLDDPEFDRLARLVWEPFFAAARKVDA